MVVCSKFSDSELLTVISTYEETWDIQRAKSFFDYLPTVTCVWVVSGLEVIIFKREDIYSGGFSYDR